MKPHFLYHRSTEIMTVLIFLALGGYFISSLSGARHILNHEEAAFETIQAVYLQESAFEKTGQGIYRPLSEIRTLSPLLESLEPISLPKETNEELYSDGEYYFYFRLIEPPKSVDDYMSGQENRVPLGFEAFAWPQRFADTGELIYYVDAEGRLGVSTNERAFYNGLSSYPPELDSPRAALIASPKDPEAATWRIKRISKKR
ncbi:MAG: hypothetical protein KJ645_13415 [Planctomycetes bacterium]|nr:hypothetical protein [Planctomycetota bacterium]